MKINVGVLYGGKSTEHEISIITAVQAMNNMDQNKYEIVPIYLSKDSDMYYNSKFLDMNIYKDLDKLKRKSTKVNLVKRNNEFLLIKDSFPYSVMKKIDIAFPIMHGYNTEDGCIAGYLEVLGIPYCESDIYASAVGQDKIFQKQILKSCHIKVTDYMFFYESDYDEDSKKIICDIEKLGYPVIIKPSRQGSSVGIKIASNKKELLTAIDEALEYDEKILVEKVVSNLIELNASVVGDNKNYEVSEIEQVYGKDEILSFSDKYLSGSKSSKGMASAGRKIPADITDKERKIIENYSIEACKALNTNGVVRIDYLMDSKTRQIYLNELNIVPGSLAFYLWEAKKIKYSELLDKIIDCGVKRYQRKIKKLTSFDSNVLENFEGTKGIKK